MLNFTIVRNQGLLSDATVFYSLYYTDYGYTESVHILSSSLIVPDGQMGYEEYIPISVATFIGTNGNLTLRLTSVTAEGTAVTGLPPRIDTATLPLRWRVAVVCTLRILRLRIY